MIMLDEWWEFFPGENAYPPLFSPPHVTLSWYVKYSVLEYSLSQHPTIPSLSAILRIPNLLAEFTSFQSGLSWPPTWKI